MPDIASGGLGTRGMILDNGGRVFTLFSVDGEIGNPEELYQIEAEIHRREES
jgi:hypothetical protein